MKIEPVAQGHPVESPSGFEPKIGVVIPTLGSNDCLDQALESIARQRWNVASVVIVDQSDDDRIAGICRDWAQQLPLRKVRTHRGASHARNVGLEHLDPHVDIVGFLDDDCTYADDCFNEVIAHFTDDSFAAMSGQLRSHEARLRFGDRPERLNRRTVWTHAIEATLFCRTSVLSQVGGFDEQLGIGGPTPWQSGEGTDLLLRMMEAGYSVHYNPACEVHEHDAGGGARPDPVVKSRLYGRGTGRVYRRHYSLLACFMQVLRPAVVAALDFARGNKASFRKRSQAAIGRWEGLTGHLIGRKANHRP